MDPCATVTFATSERGWPPLLTLSAYSLPETHPKPGSTCHSAFNLSPRVAVLYPLITQNPPSFRKDPVVPLRKRRDQIATFVLARRSSQRSRFCVGCQCDGIDRRNRDASGVRRLVSRKFPFADSASLCYHSRYGASIATSMLHGIGVKCERSTRRNNVFRSVLPLRCARGLSTRPLMRFAAEVFRSDRWIAELERNRRRCRRSQFP